MIPFNAQLSGYLLALGYQRFPDRVWLLAMCRGVLPAVIAPFPEYPFPCCPGNCECSWKKTQTEKKCYCFSVQSSGRILESYGVTLFVTGVKLGSERLKFLRPHWNLVSALKMSIDKSFHKMWGLCTTDVNTLFVRKRNENFLDFLSGLLRFENLV